MKTKLALMAAVTVAGLMFAVGSGEARMDSERRTELCPGSSTPLCGYPDLPQCGPHGWRCVGPTPYGEPSNRRPDSCIGNIGPSCMYPLMPTCRSGRWVCAGPRQY